MKIDNIPPSTTPGRVDAGHAGKKAAAAADKAQAPAGAATHLSRTRLDASQDIDHARVAEIREAIAEGRLVIDTDRIADRLIASVRDLLGDRP